MNTPQPKTKGKDLRALLPMFEKIMSLDIQKNKGAKKDFEKPYLNPLQNIPAYQMATGMDAEGQLTAYGNPVINGTILNQDASRFYRSAGDSYQGNPMKPDTDTENPLRRNYELGNKVIGNVNEKGKWGYIDREKRLAEEDASRIQKDKENNREIIARQRADYLELIKRIREARKTDYKDNLSISNNG